MEIIIHGTKGGYKVLYKTPNAPFSIARDVRRIDVVNDRTTVGQSAYSIAFADSGCAYSKYIGVWDVDRNAIGNIAFSVYIPGDKCLSGNEVKELLDGLADIYKHEYIVDGNIGNKQEDWVPFNALVRQYENRLRPVLSDDAENIQAGTAEAAYIYYSSNNDLQKCLNDPYQKIYGDCRQVFFVEESLKDSPSNPLNALKHNPSNDLTGKIDLEPKYKLLFNEYADIKTEIRVNGLSCKSKEKISPKGRFEIYYSRPHYKPRRVEGTLDEIRDNISIDYDKRIITVKETELEPIEYTFKFITENHNSKPISDAKIIVEKFPSKPEVFENNYQIKTIYEDSKKYTVSAKKDPNFSSAKINLHDEISKLATPPDSTIRVKLVLKSSKKVEIIVKDKDSRNSLYEFNVYKNSDLRPSNCGNFIEFVDDEVDKLVKIRVRLPGYDESSKQFTPAVEGEYINFELTRSNISSSINPVKLPIEEKYKSMFRKKSNVVPAIAIIALVLVALAVIIFVVIKPNNTKNDSSIADISNYLEGTLLDPDSLNNIKKSHCEPEKPNWIQKIIRKTSNSSLPVYCSKIDSALVIRNAIDSGDIDKLKQLTYSNQQDKFKRAIDSTKDEYKKLVSDTLKSHKTSKVNLDSIAVLINQTQRVMLEEQAKAAEKAKAKEEAQARKAKELVEKKPVLVNPPVHPDSSASSKSAIQQPNNSLKTEFWNLVHSGNEQKDDYNNLKDKYKKKNNGDDIITYLNKICKNSASFKKFKDIPERIRKNAKTLTEIEIESSSSSSSARSSSSEKTSSQTDKKE